MTRIQKRAARTAALFLLPFGAAVATATLGDPAREETRLKLSELEIEKSSGGKVPLKVEIAETAQEKATGLMFRTKLADGEGMLFNYGKAFEVTMWMRNTYIPLDMVFIRSDGVIHRIEVKTEPLSDRIIASNGEVSAVLEIPGGAAERLGIRAGDRVRHDFFEGPPASK